MGRGRGGVNHGAQTHYSNNILPGKRTSPEPRPRRAQAVGARFRRNHQLNGLGFRRQHALGPFIVDFCCPERKVIIDVDGDSLASQVEYDKARTLWLRAHGWQVLHFTNGAVDGDIEGALEAIGEAFRSTEKSGAAR